MDRLIQLGADIVKLWGPNSARYLDGMLNTLILAVIGTLIGCLIGLSCGILQTIPCAKTDNFVKRFFLGLIRGILRCYVEIFRGTPMVLQAVFIYYGLPYFSGNTMRFDNIWLVAILVVSINTGAYMAESVRGGILSIDPGQTEGAKAIGMTHFQTMINVVLPQALRNIMPQIGNNFIINVKDTSIMFIIGFTEFFAVHKGLVGSTYAYFPSATIEMVGYLTMTLTASFLLRFIERKMDGQGSYELVQTDHLTMTVGNYNHPHRGAAFPERNPEGSHNARQAEFHEKARQAETRRKAGVDDVVNRNLDQRGER